MLSPLQLSHGSDAVETCLITRGHIGLPVASIDPRQRRRGNLPLVAHPGTKEYPLQLSHGIDAVETSARLLDKRVAARASIEPRHRRHGNLFAEVLFKLRRVASIEPRPRRGD